MVHAGADPGVRPVGRARWSGSDPATGERFETPITGGGCKPQWKADWALRWMALDVDYEMSGKDLIDSVQALRARSARALGGDAAGGFTYELFMDENSQKISKSKGNGLTMEEWLRYAPAGDPGAITCSSRRSGPSGCIFDVIPRAVDEYLAAREAAGPAGAAPRTPPSTSTTAAATTRARRSASPCC